MGRRREKGAKLFHDDEVLSIEEKRELICSFYTLQV